MPDLQTAAQAAHRRAIASSPKRVAADLSALFGQRLVAHMVGVADPKTVGRWAAGAQAPRGAADRRLRDALQVIELLRSSDDEDTVRAWFVGLNPQLDDISPVQAIREDRGRDVLIAAKAFLAGG